MASNNCVLNLIIVIFFIAVFESVMHCSLSNMNACKMRCYSACSCLGNVRPVPLNYVPWLKPLKYKGLKRAWGCYCCFLLPSSKVGRVTGRDKPGKRNRMMSHLSVSAQNFVWSLKTLRKALGITFSSKASAVTICFIPTDK